MTERKYQAKLIKKLEQLFPGCIVLKNDPNYIQGIPDLLVLYYGVWAALEVKDGVDADVQPNQAYYVDRMDEMAFASFISPDNEREVLHELQRAFSFGGAARVS